MTIKSINVQTGQVIQLPEESPEPEKVVTKSDVRQEADRRMQVILSQYPRGEDRTWPDQKSEAQAYVEWLNLGAVGQPPETPTLSGILINEETLEDLSRSVLSNADAFQVVSRRIIKSRRTLSKSNPIPLDYTDDSHWT